MEHCGEARSLLSLKWWVKDGPGPETSQAVFPVYPCLS